MTLWIDAQLSSALAHWITQTFGIQATAVRDLGLRDATDRDIFEAAGKAKAVVLTKDGDFVRLLDHFGPPPQVIWLTCGNTGNAHLRQVLVQALPQAVEQIKTRERLVEISDPW